MLPWAGAMAGAAAATTDAVPELLDPLVAAATNESSASANESMDASVATGASLSPPQPRPTQSAPPALAGTDGEPACPRGPLPPGSPQQTERHAGIVGTAGPRSFAYPYQLSETAEVSFLDHLARVARGPMWRRNFGQYLVILNNPSG